MSGSWSDSSVNSRIINSILDRLSSHVQLGYPIDPLEFCHLCLYLSKGIDYALSYGQIPDKAQHLPTLMKKIFQQKKDDLSQAAVTVLMISIKNACKIGWFQMKESEELFSIADEMGKIYCNIGNVSSGPSSCHSIIPTIMERFYPKMKLGQILLSIEAKPEYGAATADFHVTKSTNLKDKIWLLVAQTDNIETSACLISPQQVNFLLNGKGVDYRTNVRMATGPQMPTDVTGMLKYGSNLLQAVGQFNGHYVIIVAYMSVTSLLEHPVLQDYVQPAVTSVDSDPDIIEGSSQISLNCPISFTRIKTPVKGRTCRHFQCFDFDNFIHMNSRRPSWRCPHCNQSVSYADICLDRNMVEVLKDVGENIVEVIFHADGSWKAVLENDHNVDKMPNKGQNCQKEQTEPQESTLSPITVSNVLDLTNDDDDRTDIMDTFEAGDRKIWASVDGQVVSPNSTSLGMNSVDVNRNVAVQIEDEFLSGFNIDRGWPDTPTVGGSEHPALPDTVSPAFNQEAESHENNSAINSVIHNQFSTPNNSQLQLNYNSVVNEYGRSSSVPRHISRIPVAVQALPVQPQALQPQQNSRTNLNSLPPSSSPATPHAILSDTERRQYFSQPPMNLPQFSGANSSALQYHSATQNRVHPAPGQLQNPCRASGLLSESRNSNLQQAPNPRTTADNHHGRVMAAASFRGLTGGQRGNVGAPLQSVSRHNDIFESQSEQNWRHPTPRMRGSLAGKQLSELSDDVRQRIITPTQPVQSSRPQGLLQPFQPNQPIQSSRPQGLQPVQPTQPVRSLRPQGLPQPIRPTQPAQSLRPQGPQPVLPTQPVQLSRPQGLLQPIQPTQLVQISRPQGLQPVQPTQLVQSSRPQGLQPVLPTQPGQSSRPQGLQPVVSTQQVQSSRPQGPQPVLPTQPFQILRPHGPQSVRPTVVSSQQDVLNNRNAHNHSSKT